MLRRLSLFCILFLFMFSCKKSGDIPEDNSIYFTASGYAWDVIYTLFPPLKGASISILEYPEKQTVADSAGYFHFDKLKNGSEVTFKVLQKDYYPYYSETFTIDSADLHPVAFQIPSNLVFMGLAMISETVPQNGMGFITSTVSTADPATFVDLGFPGEPGCTVTISPALPPENGPIYFNEQTLPLRQLTETTEDGGVLFVNVPPGEYTLYAHKPGIQFRPVNVKVFSNSLTNATPPYGLRRIRN
jgi:hypothetical protein